MKRVEALLTQIFAISNHSANNEPDAISSNIVNLSVSSSYSTSGATIIPNIQGLKAFAKIDQVLNDSPAYLGGIRGGDFLLCFGGITAANANPFSLIPDMLKQHVNKDLVVMVLRGIDCLTITVYPKTWIGRGVLGCHFTPFT